MILAYEEFLQRKKNYFALVNKRERQKWNDKQKERL
jgi:hypothetical protein